MAIAIGNVTGATADGTKSFTHDHSGGTNNVLVVPFNTDPGSTGAVTDVKYNGVSMTLGRSAQSASTSASHIWYMLDAPEGAHTVEVTTASAGTAIKCSAISLSGVDQDNPIRESGENVSGWNANFLITLSAFEAGDIVIDASTNLYDATATIGADQTAIANNGRIHTSYNTTNGSMSWTYPPQQGASVAVAFAEYVAPPVVTERGFYYKEGSTGDPTASDSVLSETGEFNTGAYTLSATGLAPETSYRVAAFATNADGTSVGATVGFTTEAAPAVGGGGMKLSHLGIRM